jgi:aryl-alcohol dehydrogenase-like predicted oxidoreductase
MKAVPLVLGGHTFITQLGNDPQPSEETQCAIVEACLDSGIRWFDTTHRPEREGLGRALKTLGRQDEAVIIGWNFFEDVGTGLNDKLDGAAPYKPYHIDEMLEQVQRGWIDYLVVHGVSVGREIRLEQETLAREWQQKGYVRKLGLWEPGTDALAEYGEDNPYEFMVAPLNIARDAAEVFHVSKETMGWETIAVSPFIRGWELDRMVEKALKVEPGSESNIRAKLADLMLRFTAFHPHVDRTVTAMRRVEWTGANVASYERGPLNDEESSWLDALRTAEV